MKIKIAGAVLTGLFFVAVAYLLFNIDAGLAIGAIPDPGRLLDPISNVSTFLFGLSGMLWQNRGIDMIIQAVFLIVAALAATVFFAEPTGRREKE